MIDTPPVGGRVGASREGSARCAAMRRIALSVLVVLFAALGAGCSAAPPPPRFCTELAGANDLTAITQAIDNVAPGHDYAANALQGEGQVRQSCPDQLYKLDRWREQVLGGS